jgi:hypothetical protein
MCVSLPLSVPSLSFIHHTSTGCIAAAPWGILLGISEQIGALVQCVDIGVLNTEAMAEPIRRVTAVLRILKIRYYIIRSS